jgi:hypothetical protein
MEDFINRISRQVAQIKGVGGTISNVTISGYLIRGLTKTYDAYKPLVNSNRADIDKVKLELLKAEASLKEEHLRSRITAPIDQTPKALAAQAGQGNNNNNNRNGRSRPNNRFSHNADAYCSFHKKPGHDTKDCITLKKQQQQNDATRPQTGGTTSTNQEPARTPSPTPYKKAWTARNAPTSALLSAPALASASIIDPIWYLDSGATDHFTGNKASFTSYEDVTPFPISLGDESLILVEGKGSLTIATTTGYNIQLKDVLYSPHFKNTSLLSIAKVTQAGVKITFTQGLVQLVDEGITVATGSYSPDTGLYHLDQLPTRTSRALKATKSLTTTSLETWHRRFGHLNVKYILNSVDSVRGLMIQNQYPFDCDPCHMSKITRATMESTYPEVLKPGEYLTIDMWGPARVVSLGGNSYMLSTTCKGTKYRMASFTLDRKSYFPDLLAQVKFIENQTGNTVKRLRLDNAPEFVSQKVKDYCKEKGIRLEPTTYYTPEQNGISERSMRTITEADRTLLEDSQLPYEFWEEANAYSIYAYNRCNLPKIGKTPYEAFYGTRPDVAHLRVFGSLAYVHIPKETADWHKLKTKAFRGILTGYGGSGYRIWNPLKREFYISNHCRVLEHQKGAKLLTWATQLQRRMSLESLQEYEDSEADNDDPNTLYGDTIIVDTGRALETTSNDSIIENNASNTSIDTRGGESRDLSDSHASLSNQQPDDQQHDNQHHDLPEASNARDAALARGNIWVRGQELPRRPYSRRIAGEPTEHAAFMAQSSPNEVPNTIKEALTGPDADKWRLAIKSEMSSLLRNHTWDLVIRPQQKTIDSKWIFKIKSSGRYKARLVARGYTQEYGVDYFETFAPVARLATIRMVLALAAKYNLHIQQMDVQTAFLYGDLEEECYMEQPPGFINDKSLVCFLRKSIYGLKQAPRVWYQVIDRFFLSAGFKRSLSDPALYIQQDHQPDDMPLIVAIYVDDLILVGPKMDLINVIKSKLNDQFQMTDMGDIQNLLGMEVLRLQDGSIFLYQQRYLSDMLNRYQMESCTPTDTPISRGLVPDGNDVDVKEYQSRTGSLMWPSLATRPDICYTAGFLGRSNADPKVSHSTAQKRAMRYLQGTLDYGILYDASSNEGLIGYSDADYGGDIADRKSTTGTTFTILGGAVTWSSSKQPTVATATLISEYIALAHTVKEALWIKQLLEEIGINVGPIKIKVDSQGALDLARNARFSQKTKHIDIKYHFIRDHIQTGDVILEYLRTDDMTADILTKALPKASFNHLRAKLGIKSIKNLNDVTSSP